MIYHSHLNSAMHLHYLSFTKNIGQTNGYVHVEDKLSSSSEIIVYYKEGGREGTNILDLGSLFTVTDADTTVTTGANGLQGGELTMTMTMASVTW